MANQYTVNEYGMTSGEWMNTAHFGASTFNDEQRARVASVSRRKLLKAWRAGECPCDWAAYFATGV